MNDLYRSMRNRTPPMVVRILRKRHATGPMAQRPQPNSCRPAPATQA